MIEPAYAAGQQEPSIIGFLLPIFILVLMYFILIRPQSKKLKEHKKMVASLKVGDEINGHFVFGHVDGLSKVVSIKHLEDSVVLEFEVEKNIIKYLSPKCSIALDGISLTVNNISKSKFNVSIIPYTWENTSLKKVEKGDFLNTEVDMLARYVFKALKK